MSYSSDVKSEIAAGIEIRTCCDKAFINSALCFFNVLTAKKLRFKTAAQSVALCFYAVLREITGISFSLSRLKDNFVISLEDEKLIRSALEKAGCINKKTGEIQSTLNDSLSINGCCQQSVLKGAFLAGGYIADPKKAYHFEIVSRRTKLIERIQDMLLSFDIDSKTVKRGANTVLYIKEKEMIADVLSLLNATNSFFSFQEVMVEKEVKNSLNRRQNFEQANLDKTLDASLIQCAAIEKLKSSGGFDSLSSVLKEAAELRLSNPHASLGELASMTSDGVSRSGMNHRLKKLMEEAGKYE